MAEEYRSCLDLRQTQVAIKAIKDYFEDALADALHLTRVSAPLFVRSTDGLNDNLSGKERPVSFDILQTGEQAEIVHSLAKWKRMALGSYGFAAGEGLYTDMNAIRRDEELDALHSLYVDQWDWEMVISPEDRNEETLRDIVRRIYACLLQTQNHVRALYPQLPAYLPDEIHFITSQQLLDLYPNLNDKERENAICQKYGAVFLMQIGGKLSNGAPHDNRAPDYDDWRLNGDILLWYPPMQRAYELSSMGIRVGPEELRRQCTLAGCEARLQLPFHSKLLREELPYTVGGGIGQSRICMYLLSKAHIGEVQVSIWPQEMIAACAKKNIQLL